MKVCEGCKLFGAYEALSGIENSVLLLHSVTGCNYGTLTLELSRRMDAVRQCCTVINEEDVILGGERSLKTALLSVWELYQPQVVFVVSGCVSGMIGDDVKGSIQRAGLPCPVLWIPAPGFSGGMQDGYEDAVRALLTLMEDRTEGAEKERQPLKINILGIGSGDVRILQDVEALRTLLKGHGEILCCLADCTVAEIRRAASADLNLVFGKGVQLAEAMQEKYGIPYEILDFPYGLLGTRRLIRTMEKCQCRKGDASSGFRQEDVLKSEEERVISALKKIYAYMQALYGTTAAVIGTASRARGMRTFLEEELGMDVVCYGERESLADLEDFFDQVRKQDTAILFGSSFEKELADELGIPLLRYDYPVFDRICISQRPYLGPEGVLCLVEDILNEVMAAKKKKGALYQ